MQRTSTHLSRTRTLLLPFQLIFNQTLLPRHKRLPVSTIATRPHSTTAPSLYHANPPSPNHHNETHTLLPRNSPLSPLHPRNPDPRRSRTSFDHPLSLQNRQCRPRRLGLSSGQSEPDLDRHPAAAHQYVGVSCFSLSFSPSPSLPLFPQCIYPQLTPPPSLPARLHCASRPRGTRHRAAQELPNLHRHLVLAGLRAGRLQRRRQRLGGPRGRRRGDRQDDYVFRGRVGAGSLHHFFFLFALLRPLVYVTALLEGTC
jgi:hypothetical protein